MTALIYIDMAALVLVVGYLLVLEVADRRRERRAQSADPSRDWQWPTRPNKRTGD